ncbi:hypothetical protein CERSUDRAFT_94638 [Gelatoporia subvermispora B]|uniref:Calcineurin-like phosphoesterase domain-containing protein n=1 Tax=Ceriporiopsis subvermispora (strain B) TaxID=914234 RepID=M2QKT2_CERS8|nr:hypothetical protein CERSUDRAFT_94638 [Gelatoporia subvermispora B]
MSKATVQRQQRRWLPSLPTLVNCIRVFWVVLILWYELGTFSSHASDCPWPSPSGPDPLPSHTLRVLIVADPQVLDHRSYPARNALLMWLTQKIVDLNLRKSWWAIMRRSPDAIMFLGDMMDNGRVDMSDAEYESYYKRFKSIFRPPSDVPAFYLPGNHDVGLGSSVEFAPAALDRYHAHFGESNQELRLGNHTALLINAPGLVEEDAQRAQLGIDYVRYAKLHPFSTIAFIHSYATLAKQDTETVSDAILFTHIPLSRPPAADCGPLRERGTIKQGTGLGYQNTLTTAASIFVLQSVQPSIIFSGDDHDYCDIVHTIPPGPGESAGVTQTAHEITVRSISMAMGVRRPGYQLLSLLPQDTVPPPHTALVTAPCLLPDQIAIITHIYVPAALLSLAVLLYARLAEVGAKANKDGLLGLQHSHARARNSILRSWAGDCVRAAWVPLLAWGIMVTFVL